VRALSSVEADEVSNTASIPASEYTFDSCVSDRLKRARDAPCYLENRIFYHTHVRLKAEHVALHQNFLYFRRFWVVKAHTIVPSVGGINVSPFRIPVMGKCDLEAFLFIIRVKTRTKENMYRWVSV
jgi:hypothetical protein